MVLGFLHVQQKKRLSTSDHPYLLLSACSSRHNPLPIFLLPTNIMWGGPLIMPLPPLLAIDTPLLHYAFATAVVAKTPKTAVPNSAFGILPVGAPTWSSVPQDSVCTRKPKTGQGSTFCSAHGFSHLIFRTKNQSNATPTNDCKNSSHAKGKPSTFHIPNQKDRK